MRLTWAIGGNLVATIFSSAGPCYYGLLGLGGEYDSLLKLLHDHAATGALTVVETQALLWEFNKDPQSVNAISAFPSMHVASSVLMACFAFQWSRLAGLITTAFAVVIMIGSVLLAWHYAVDGYAGALIAISCWKIAGVLNRSRFGAFPAEAASSRS
jgi:membrane-associated phospholipid phosphatase